MCMYPTPLPPDVKTKNHCYTSICPCFKKYSQQRAHCPLSALNLNPTLLTSEVRNETVDTCFLAALKVTEEAAGRLLVQSA